MPARFSNGLGVSFYGALALSLSLSLSLKTAFCRDVIMVNQHPYLPKQLTKLFSGRS